VKEFTVIHGLLIGLLGLLALGCLILAIRQFRVIYPIKRNDQIIRSVKIAGFSTLFSIIMILITGVLIWAKTGIFQSIVLAIPMLFIVPFVSVISAIGSFVQFSWYAKVVKYRDNLIQQQIDHGKLEPPDVHPE
jgi:hypothetical protein